MSSLALPSASTVGNNNNISQLDDREVEVILLSIISADSQRDIQIPNEPTRPRHLLSASFPPSYNTALIVKLSGNVVTI
jgi:hypothetical protein